MYCIRFFDGDTFKILTKPRSSAFSFDTSFTTPGVGWNAVPYKPIPPDGAIFVYGNLFIDAPKNISSRPDLIGINGRLTIAASDTIIILHNIYYHCSNLNGYIPNNCDDVLGLISEKFLLVSKNCNAPLYPAQGSLIVNAAIAALSGSFGCEDVGNAPEYNDLMFQGSVATLYRGVFHRGSAGYGSGFVNRHIKYDQRLEGNPPPYFVSTNKYREIYVE